MTTDDTLAHVIRALPGRTGGLDAPELLALHRRRKWRRRAAASAVLVAAGLLAIPLTITNTGQQARGIMAADPVVQIHAVAEGPDGRRALPAGAKILPDERVVFAIESSDRGSVTLTEHGPGGTVAVWPTTGEWMVKGKSWVGGDKPLSWRPATSGQHTYRARWCEADHCVDAGLELVWR